MFQGNERFNLILISAVVFVAFYLPLQGVLAQKPKPSRPLASEGTKETFPRQKLAIPFIKEVLPKGCVKGGDQITMTGKQFGSERGKTVAIERTGIHIDLSSVLWKGSRIVARLPISNTIIAGQSFVIGIEKRGSHGGWLSNLNHKITFCPKNASLSTPKHPKTGPIVGTRGNPPTALAEEDFPDDPFDEESGEFTDEETLDTRPFFPGGGSLLGRGLPPSPPASPLIEEKESESMEPGEIVIISATMSEAVKIAKKTTELSFAIKRRQKLSALALVISVFRLPDGMTVKEALERLREKHPKLWTDANHRYRLLSGQKGDVKRYAQRLIGWTKTTSTCGIGLRIGLIDTMVDENHEGLKGQHLLQRSFLTPGIARSPMDHGTAIAALLIGKSQVTAPSGLVPGATLYVAGIFRLRGKREIDTTVESLILALDWLVSRKNQVINMSLGGPRNLILEVAIQRVLSLGIVVTAAAGNGGAKASPVYPAAQKGVIAVTAVDANLKRYKKANQGDYIDFSAPGVDLWTAKLEGGGAFVSGTSFAVPFVTAAMGVARIKNVDVPFTTLLKKMQLNAHDLGSQGKDPVFGWGLVQTPETCE